MEPEGVLTVAIRERQHNANASAFAGGIARWVGRREARRLARQIRALKTAGEFREWYSAAPSDVQAAVRGYELWSRAADPAAPLRGGALITSLIPELARFRLYEAMSAQGLGSMRDLVCCPTCPTPLEEIAVGLYCKACRSAEEQELAELLGGAPSGART